MNDTFKVDGIVELFPGKGGWYFVRLPKTYTDITKPLAVRGFVPITAMCGNSAWQSSLLPMGDGTQIIALPAKVRKVENIEINQKVVITFCLRER